MTRWKDNLANGGKRSRRSVCGWGRGVSLACMYSPRCYGTKVPFQPTDTLSLTHSLYRTPYHPPTHPSLPLNTLSTHPPSHPSLPLNPPSLSTHPLTPSSSQPSVPLNPPSPQVPRNGRTRSPTAPPVSAASAASRLLSLVAPCKVTTSSATIISARSLCSC